MRFLHMQDIACMKHFDLRLKTTSVIYSSAFGSNAREDAALNDTNASTAKNANASEAVAITGARPSNFSNSATVPFCATASEKRAALIWRTRRQMLSDRVVAR